MCLCWFSIFSCFVGGFTTTQDLKHTKNREVQADAFICNFCLAALKTSFSFQLLSVNHSQKLNRSSNSDKFSLRCILPQHAAFFFIWKPPFPHLTWTPFVKGWKHFRYQWGKFKIFLRLVCKFYLRWDEQNWINIDGNMSLIIFIIVTGRERYLSPACCLWYWQRKKFIRSEKRLLLNFWV